MTARNNTHARKAADSTLLVGLRQIFDPIVHALDDRPALLKEDSADTGSELPSTKDIMLRITISMLCQTLYNQLHGKLKTNSGSNIPNLKERLDDSEGRIASIAEITSKQDVAAFHWFAVNEAKYNSISDFLSAMTTIYFEITNERWQPREMGGTNATNAKKIDVDTLPQEEKDRLVSLMAAKERIEARKKQQASAAA